MWAKKGNFRDVKTSDSARDLLYILHVSPQKSHYDLPNQVSRCVISAGKRSLGLVQEQVSGLKKTF